MRLYLTIALIVLCGNSFAQSAGRREKPGVYSASSEWQKVTLEPITRSQASLPVTVPVPTGQATAAPTGRTETGTVSTPIVPARPSTLANSTSDYRPAFAGDFATNRMGPAKLYVYLNWWLQANSAQRVNTTLVTTGALYRLASHLTPPPSVLTCSPTRLRLLSLIDQQSPIVPSHCLIHCVVKEELCLPGNE